MTTMPLARSRHWIAGATLVAVLAACQRQPAVSVNVPGIPIYPGAQLEQVLNDEDRDPTEFYVVARTAASTVHDWYVREMRARQWLPTTDEVQEVILYTDPQGCWAAVSVVQDGADVNLQVSQQRPGTPCTVVPTLDPGDD